MDRSQRILAGIPLFVGLCVLGSALLFKDTRLPFWIDVVLVCAGAVIGLATLRESMQKTYRYLDGGVLKRDTLGGILRLQQCEMRDVMAASPDREAFLQDGMKKAAGSYWVRLPVLRGIRFRLNQRTLRRNEQRRRVAAGARRPGRPRARVKLLLNARTRASKVLRAISDASPS